MKPVAFHPEAMAELFDAARYYEHQQPGLGRHFFAAVREATNRIQTFPLLYRVVENDIRQCRVPRFPYGLIYRPKADRLEIIPVMHLHRDPGYWKSRVKSE